MLIEYLCRKSTGASGGGGGGGDLHKNHTITIVPFELVCAEPNEPSSSSVHVVLIYNIIYQQSFPNSLTDPYITVRYSSTARLCRCACYLTNGVALIRHSPQLTHIYI